MLILNGIEVKNIIHYPSDDLPNRAGPRRRQEKTLQLQPPFEPRIARRHLDPSSPMKLAVGLIILGLAFVVMIGAARLVAEGQQVFPSWLITQVLAQLLMRFPT